MFLAQTHNLKLTENVPSFVAAAVAVAAAAEDGGDDEDDYEAVVAEDVVVVDGRGDCLYSLGSPESFGDERTAVVASVS